MLMTHANYATVLNQRRDTIVNRLLRLSFIQMMKKKTAPSNRINGRFGDMGL